MFKQTEYNKECKQKFHIKYLLLLRSSPMFLWNRCYPNGRRPSKLKFWMITEFYGLIFYAVNSNITNHLRNFFIKTVPTVIGEIDMVASQTRYFVGRERNGVTIA